MGEFIRVHWLICGGGWVSLVTSIGWETCTHEGIGVLVH